jgi:hypothetical protein
MFLIYNTLLYSQEDVAVLYLNENGLTIDSLANLIDNKNIPYKEKITLVYKNFESREIEFLYNTEKEDIKIKQLKNINHRQLQANTMLITAIVLLVILIVLLWLLSRTMNRNFRNRYKLILTEKREAEINLKINEERAAKSLLEKHEVLSDSRIKEIEIEGKNRELKILLKEKEALDNEIEAFAKKIHLLNKLTKNKKSAGTTGNTENQLIIEDLIALLNKKLPRKPEYVELLRSLDCEYITILKNSFTGYLSKSCIKYCLCFVTGMEISEVSECFEIEPSSVHVLRYRLKKRIDQAGSESLDEFLKKLC